MTAVMIGLVRDEHGDDGVAALLRASGSPRSMAFLESEDSWISLDEAIALLEASCRVTGDPAFPRRVGEHAVRRHAGTSTATLLRSLGSPEAVLGAIAMTAAKFSTVTEMEPLEAGPGRAVVRAAARAGHPRHPLHCQWTQGLLSVITVLFGEPPAAIEESCCQAEGAPECRYTITWDAERAAAGADPQQRVTALEAQLIASRERLRGAYETAGDLLSVDDLDVVLARIVDRAGETVRAPRYVLAVRPGPEADQRLYTDGVDDADAARIAAAAAAGEDLGASALVADVASNRCAYGRLIALNDEGAFFPQEQELLELYARHAAAVLDMATALEESARRHDQVSALLHLAHALAATGASRAVAERLAEAVPNVVDCDRMSVLLWDERDEHLLTTAAWGIPDDQLDFLRRTPIRAADSEAVRQMLSEPRALFLDPATADGFLGQLMTSMGVVRMVAVPIVALGDLLGVLTASVVDRPERLRRDPALLERLTGVAALAAPALRNGRLVDELQHQAAHDPLTGLANRAGFARRMTSVIEQAGDETTVGLLFVDLDGFKRVNDEHGHGAGDALLRDAAARLASITRAGDTVARLGGDEFAVILGGVTGDDEVAAAARRVREAFARPFSVDGTEVHVGASVGEARWPADGDGVDALIRHADAAMYREKLRARA